MKVFIWFSGHKVGINSKKAAHSLAEMRRFSLYQRDLNFSQKNVFLGALKLQVEPYKNIYEQNNKIVLIDGYIFNPKYIDEKTSLNKAKKIRPFFDIESFLDQYKKLGVRFIRRLNGSFTVIIYDAKSNKLEIINDRYGSRPLFYYFNDKELILASEIKAFPKHIFESKNLNFRSLASFISYRQCFNGETFIKNIFLMPPGQLFKFQNNKLRKIEYFNINAIPPNNLSNAHRLKKAVELYKNAILKSAYAFKDGLFTPLSGGYDTRLICALIKQNKTLKIKLKTISTDKDLPPFPLDSIIAKKIANRFKIPNKTIYLPENLYSKYFLKKIYLLDGLSAEHLWLMPLFDNIKKAGVALDGFGGDIQARTSEKMILKTKKSQGAKYLANLFFPLVSPAKLPKGTFLARPTFDIAYTKRLLKEKYYKVLSENQRSQLIDFLSRLNLKSQNLYPLFVYARTLENALYLSNNILGKKLFIVYPYLENQLFGFLSQIPAEEKIKMKFTQKTLKILVPKAMQIESTNDENIKERYQYKSRESIMGNQFTTAYLKKLLRTIDIPEFVRSNKKQFLNEMGKIVGSRNSDQDFALLEFLVWHNMFISNKKARLR